MTSGWNLPLPTRARPVPASRLCRRLPWSFYWSSGPARLGDVRSCRRSLGKLQAARRESRESMLSQSPSRCSAGPDCTESELVICSEQPSQRGLESPNVDLLLGPGIVPAARWC